MRQIVRFVGHYLCGISETIKDLLIEDLQEIDKRFDIVISSEVIEHVEEPWAFTAYCSNLVKEDGDLIMTTVNRTQVRLLNSDWSRDISERPQN